MKTWTPRTIITGIGTGLLLGALEWFLLLVFGLSPYERFAISCFTAGFGIGGFVLLLYWRLQINKLLRDLDAARTVLNGIRHDTQHHPACPAFDTEAPCNCGLFELLELSGRLLFDPVLLNPFVEGKDGKITRAAGGFRKPENQSQ